MSIFLILVACVVTYLGTLLLTPVFTVLAGFLWALLPGKTSRPVPVLQMMIYCMADLAAIAAGGAALRYSKLFAYFPCLLGVVLLNTLVYFSGKFDFPTEEAARRNRVQKQMSLAGTLLAVLVAGGLFFRNAI